MDLKTALLEELKNKLNQSGLPVTQTDQEKLVNYIVLLHEWNAVHNLTGVKDPMQMITRHLLDSLVLMPILTGHKIIDVGTGAGLPGIPLAITLPHLNFVLIDSNQKKINFVQHVIISLNLKNVEAICQRVEKYQPPVLFDWAVSRAFASLKDFIAGAGHLIKQQGTLLAMKGKNDSSEFSEIPQAYQLADVRPVDVPGEIGERTLVLVRKL